MDRVQRIPQMWTAHLSFRSKSRTCRVEFLEYREQDDLGKINVLFREKLFRETATFDEQC